MQINAQIPKSQINNIHTPETGQTVANTNNDSEPPTKDTPEIPKPRREETIDPKNQTGHNRALSTASQGSNKNPVKPNDLDLDPKGICPQSLKKQSLKKHIKSLEPIFKKPKCPESPVFTLDRIDDMLEPATYQRQKE